eukprot:scaffold33336_cov143-Skeletonema_menzelii.AAC.3
METIPQYLSETGQECCEKFYARHGVPLDRCYIQDVCAETKWHVSKYNALICTNSGDHPLSWNDPALAPHHLFESAERCCEVVIERTGGECDIRDINEPWDCSKWHLAIEKDANGGPLHQEGTCTNSGVIHEVWANYEQHYIFPDHQTCCEKFQIPLDECFKADACGPPTKPPSKPPTPAPSPKPTTPVPTTIPPTPVPTTTPPTPVPTTAAPTGGPMVTNSDAPTCTSASSSVNGSFHPDKYGTLSCTNSNDYPPSWDSILDGGEHEFLFDTMEDCVNYFQQYLDEGDEISVMVGAMSHHQQLQHQQLQNVKWLLYTIILLQPWTPT